MTKYQVHGAIRLALEPNLTALDNADDVLSAGDIVEGYELKDKKGQTWIYIPYLDRFIWYGRKVEVYRKEVNYY